MFVLVSVADSIRIPPDMFDEPTIDCVQDQIDEKYPNRILMDVGLVICRYGSLSKKDLGDGVCVCGDGGAHHEVVFRLLVFRPFLEEVLVGTIWGSNEEGIKVSIGGFFDEIFIPAYWMLSPSHFDKHKKLWAWTPNYGDEDEDEDEGEGEQQEKDDEGNDGDDGEGEQQEKDDEGNDEDGQDIKQENSNGDNKVSNEEEEEETGYEMTIGSQIRFKVKSINFTKVTNTVKGAQATTTTTSKGGQNNSNSKNSNSGENNDGSTSKPVRKRSISFDLTESQKTPSSMHIVGSICEDGLGLVSWWESGQDDDDQEEGEGDDDGGEEENYEEYNTNEETLVMEE